MDGSELKGGVPAPSIARAQDQLFAPGRSAREKYAALVIGRPGFGAMLKYETVVMLSDRKSVV